ncbi:PP2C family protein-serine/threonine phosphatase [Streptomyces sp. NPDC004959]|uniref:PP2C family protein-serine/threonine phosphatase n=1 Tax=unclassified Streptomyces TaxID=2593676 RepID=UPI00131B054D|nr:PP2C family protein-serine/threonine phosphatase [Streptomyces sp. NRRL F-5630]
MLGRVVPPLLVVGGFVFGLFAPATFTGAPFFAAAPLVAAPFASSRVTAGVGGLAAAGESLLQVIRGRLPTGPFLIELTTVLTVAALAVLINLLIRRGDRRLASVQNVAAVAQSAVLPVPAERIGGLDVAAQYEAAEADAFIGGDLYAVQDTPYGVRMVLGDVRGKGLGAVEAVSVVIGAFREAAEQEPTVEGVAQRLERALAREGLRRRALDAFEGFTTAVLAEIPRGAAELRLVNRGHTEPLLLERDGRLRVLTPGEHALPLGMGELGAWPDRAEIIDFPPGATLLLYTDGLSEARDARGRFYDPVARLSGRVFPHPRALLTTLTDEVRRYTGGATTDDMALLAVRRPEDPDPGTTDPAGATEASVTTGATATTGATVTTSTSGTTGTTGPPGATVEADTPGAADPGGASEPITPRESSDNN